MKVGDKYDVTIAGQVVTQAEVRELADGQVTLIVPGTKVVMATRTDIAAPEVNTDGSGTQVIIDGVERAGSESAVSNDTQETAPVEVAQPGVVETNQEVVQNDTVQGDAVQDTVQTDTVENTAQEAVSSEAPAETVASTEN